MNISRRNLISYLVAFIFASTLSSFFLFDETLMLEGYKEIIKYNRSERNSSSLPLLRNLEFSGCLLVKNEGQYDMLSEWIAYHYTMAKLRHLIICVDKGSKTSPYHQLSNWRDLTELKVQVLPESHFFQNKTQSKYEGCYNKCAREFILNNRTWMFSINLDEYLVFHTSPQLNDEYNKTNLPQHQKNWTIVDYVAKQEQNFPNNLSPCFQLPYLQFYPYEKVNSSKSSTSLRFFSHANSTTFGQKSYLLDISRINQTENLFSKRNHYCQSALPPSMSSIRINKYLLTNHATTPDIQLNLSYAMMGWLQKFSNEVGDEKSTVLLKDAIRSTFKPGITTMNSNINYPSQPKRNEYTEKNKNAAICTIAKNEEQYIDEWVDYNLALGFQKVYIYDNSDNFTLQEWSLKRANVTVIHYPGISKQTSAQIKCVTELGKKHTWMALFDVDEFLVLKKHANVVDLLKSHCTEGSLAIHWYIFGTSGQTNYSSLPVTKRFTYREKNLSKIIKSIVKVSDFAGYKTPHSFKVSRGKQHDTAGNTKFSPTQASSINWNKFPSDVAVLHHYKYKSLQEWIFKGCARKRASGANTWCGVKPPPGEVYDDSAWRFLKQKEPKYQK